MVTTLVHLPLPLQRTSRHNRQIEQDFVRGFELGPVTTVSPNTAPRGACP
jgi:hypothetical protein